VYPPFLSAYLGANSLNILATASSSLRNANAFLLDAKVFFLPKVIILSANFLNSLALVTVVSILSAFTSDIVIFLSIAFL
jgi:hypothetical protein